MLHPDDFAAARAYCHALDLQRGRTPWQPGQQLAPVVDAEAQAEMIRATRDKVFAQSLMQRQQDAERDDDGLLPNGLMS